MRGALVLTAGLALAAVALSPLPAAGAACAGPAKDCRRGRLITIGVKAKGPSHALGGARVTYTLRYSMTWMESFAPYWGSFWVGGRFPKGARGPARATVFDASGRRFGAFPCRRYADGVWCDVGGDIPHRGRVVLTARLARHAGTAVARLGFDSFDGLNEREAARDDGRAVSREKYCNFRFVKTVTTMVRL
ncbi:hypothetical protein GCM10017673_05480 [Streptosporangium violaceochromogenes]|nr:hypothetical protein GCM10017673_05480 [Streptosporangium violaceochromogenes]